MATVPISPPKRRSSIRLPSPKVTRRHLVVIAVGIILSAIWLLVHRPYAALPQPTTQQANEAKKEASNNAYTTPQFPTVLPADKSIDSLGGWTRVSPATSDPVFAYKDTLDGTEVIVSQQPLPKGFEQDTDTKVEELATSFNATEHLPFAGGTAYIGNSTKGPQTIIATKNGLLILIKSPLKHSNDAWTAYLASLR